MLRFRKIISLFFGIATLAQVVFLLYSCAPSSSFREGSINLPYRTSNHSEALKFCEETTSINYASKEEFIQANKDNASSSPNINREKYLELLERV
jgi:hypothetical protein